MSADSSLSLSSYSIYIVKRPKLILLISLRLHLPKEHHKQKKEKGELLHHLTILTASPYVQRVCSLPVLYVD